MSANKADHSGGAGESSDASGTITSGGGVGGNSGTAPQSVSWRAHQVDLWYEMCDATLQDM